MKGKTEKGIYWNITHEEFMKYAENPPSFDGETFFNLQVITIDRRYRRRYPKYRVDQLYEAYFKTLAEAEEFMRSNRTGKAECDEQIYCYKVYEYPYSRMLCGFDVVSCRVYDELGTLLDQTRCAGAFGNKHLYSNFFGRPDDQVRFKGGDIVEVLCGDDVRLAVVYYPPSSPEQVWEAFSRKREKFKRHLMERHIKSGGKEENFELYEHDDYFDGHDYYDDQYMVLDTVKRHDHDHILSVNVFKPRFRVSAKMRQRLEYTYQTLLRKDEGY